MLPNNFYYQSFVRDYRIFFWKPEFAGVEKNEVLLYSPSGHLDDYIMIYDVGGHFPD